MKSILLSCLMFLLVSVSPALAAMQLEINYQKTGLSSDGAKQNISGWVTLLNDNANLKGVLVVFDSPEITVDNRNADYNHDGFYSGKPFWNLGNVIARGGGVAELKFQVPANATTLNLTATILESVAAPVANAGPDRVAETGKVVVLDGSRTFDPDGNRLTYKWVFKVKPISSLLTDADIKDAGMPNPYFIPDAEGLYEIGLDVSDGTNVSADIVAIYVTDVSRADPAPRADAGPDRFGVVGQQLKFDGRNSYDPKGEMLTFEWSFIHKPKGSAVTEANFDTASVRGMCIFTPDVEGKYILKLKVRDPGGKSTTSTAKALVVAVTDNLPPSANFGANQQVFVGKTVSLDGSLSSDPEKTALTYVWQLLGKPSGSSAALSSPSAAVASFTPDTEGVYTVGLTVKDGVFESLPAIVQFTAFDQDAGIVTPGSDQTLADALNNASPVDGSAVITITSPFQGAVYPTNVQPRFAWNFTGGALDGSKVVISYTLNGISKTASFITVDNFYTPSSAIWSELSTADNDGAVSFVVYVKAGSAVYSSRTVTFNVSDAKVAGSIIYWGVQNTSNIYSLQADGSSLPTPIYGDLTGNGCAGCHSVSQTGKISINDYAVGSGSYRLNILSLSDMSTALKTFDPLWSAVTSWDATGSKMLYTVATGASYDTYSYDLNTGSSTPVQGLDRSDRDEVMAVWAPDGSIVAVVKSAIGVSSQFYSFNDSGTAKIVRLLPDGTETILSDVVQGFNQYYPSVSPDGKWVVFNRSSGTSYSAFDSKLWLVPMDGSAGPREMTAANGSYLDSNGQPTSYGNSWPTWAPDSSWVAFSSNRPMPGPDGQIQSDWSLFTANIDATGKDSVAIPIPGAAAPNMGEHIPYWIR